MKGANSDRYITYSNLNCCNTKIGINRDWAIRGTILYVYGNTSSVIILLYLAIPTYVG